MAEALVIRLKAASAAIPRDTQRDTQSPHWLAEWLVVDSSGVPHGKVESGELANAVVLAGGRKIIVFVPGTDVLLAEPILPPRSGAKLLQVVPFALEEQLASDVEDLHFAVGRRHTQAGTPVAVVAQARMEEWLAILRDAGLHPEALYAETTFLPTTPNGVTFLLDQACVYVRREAMPGAVLDVEPLIEAVQLVLAAGEAAHEHVTIYLTADVYERERELLEGLREFTASLQLKLLPEGPLPLLAANTFQVAPINLLQGRYVIKTQLNLSFRPWRYAALLAMVFIALHLGLKTWQYIDLQRTNARLDSEIAQVFQQVMPGAPLPDTTAARKQIEMRLNALRGSGPVGGIMATLGTLSEALAQAPGASIEALSYRDNITDLRVLAPSVDALDKIQHVATERGLATQIQSASPRAANVEGRMQFKRSGA